MTRLVILAAAASTICGVAAADTAYLEPSTYSPELGQTITIEASFNDYCCVPKYPVRSDSYAVILPDGSSVEPDRIELFANSTILEQKIAHEGTTRITTGERLGRKGEYVLLDGQYHLVNSDDAEPIEVPDGTPILTSQTATVSDFYVTVGEQTWESIEVPVGRLGISPQQHPSDLRVGDAFEVTLSFDGEPLADQPLILTRSGQKDRVEDEGITFISNVDGHVAIPLEHIGTHLIMTRMQAPAPEEAQTDIRSYTTSLTFDVAAGK